LHKISLDSVKNEDLISDYVQLHPHLKISAELYDIFHENFHPESKSDDLSLSIRVVVNNLTSVQYDDLVLRMTSLFQPYVDKATASYDMQYPEEGMETETRRLYGVARILRRSEGWEVLELVANQPEVLWLEQDHPVQTHNKWAKGVCDTGEAFNTPLDSMNITGQSEVIGIGDTGLDVNNCFFFDATHTLRFQTNTSTLLNPKHRKIVQYVAAAGIGDRFDSSEGHGTHVAGTVAGLAYQNYGDYADYSGQNIGTKIAFFDLMVGDAKTASATTLKLPSDLNTNLLQLLYKAGARVFTMSWGTTSNNYDTLAVQVDLFLWNFPDCVVFFSAGNNGASGANSLSSPSTNKNGVSVGASLNDHASWVAMKNEGSSVFGSQNMAWFSSRGPTADNRLKPDLLAPGYYVQSAKGQYQSTGYHCDIQGLSGTSMSAPNAAAMAIKVRQYFLQGYYPTGKKNAQHAFTPSGALIKAMLVHSSQRVSNVVATDGSTTPLTTYPSTVQGYGRLQLSAVLNFAASNASQYDPLHPLTLFVIGNANRTTRQGDYAAFTAAGQTHTYNFSTSGSTSQSAIRVTLAYTDYPGSAMSISSMVNKLVVSVRSATGRSFSPYLPSGLVQSNMQVIDIPSPTPSTYYFVTVTSSALSRSPQPYALVMTGTLQYATQTSPSSTSSSGSSSSSSKYSHTDYFNTSTTPIFYVLAIVALLCLVFLIWIIRLTSKKELQKFHQQLATFLKANHIAKKKKNKVSPATK